MWRLATKDKGPSFSDTKLDDWKVNTCPMSSSVFNVGSRGVLGTWENNGQVFFTAVGANSSPASAIAAPGNAKGRKHPALASNAAGQILLAWTEGMGWDRGGTMVWQLYDKDGKPTAQKGSAPGGQ